MNPYLAKILNEEGKSQVHALLVCNITTPTELKDQVISSNNGSYIYYGALAIYETYSFKKSESILNELKQALFNSNDYFYILDFMRYIKVSNIESYLNKLVEANDPVVLIETLNYITYINPDYLNEEKRTCFIEAFIKKLISIKAYDRLCRYLHDKSSKICYMAINNGDKEFLKAYHKTLSYYYQNFGYEDSTKKYMNLVAERIQELNLEDNSLTPDETLNFFQSLVEKNDYNAIKKYGTNFHSLFIDKQAKLTK